MSKTRTISYDNRVRFFWIMVVVSILSLSIYVYAVNATARNIVVRRDLEKQITSVSSSLNSLEFAYIELRNNITIELAYLYGFKEVRNPLYISRTNPASLSYNTLRR